MTTISSLRAVARRIVEGTPMRNDRGWNLSKVACPSCGLAQPRIRRPRSEQQRQWGGWTCRGCAREMDKWGRELPR